MNILRQINIIIFVFVLLFLNSCSGLGLKSIKTEKLENEYFNKNSKYTKILNNNVHYRDKGNIKKPALFLIHGLVSALQTWDGWVNYLQKDFRIVRLDLPGFGLSGPTHDKNYSKKIWIDTVNNLAKKLEIDSFSIAGNSLGGYVAWNYAITYPDKVEKLILIDPVGYPQKMPFTIWLFSLPIFRDMAKFTVPRFIFEYNVRQVYGDINKVTKKSKDLYYNMALREGAICAYVKIFKLLRKRANDKSISYGIDDIKCPTLIMWGNKDAWVPIEHLKKWHKAVKNASIRIYDGAGHIPMEEIPEQTAQDAKEFLLKK